MSFVQSYLYLITEVFIGSRLLVLLPSRRWAGDALNPSLGVFLQFKNDMFISSLLILLFRIKFFAILTLASAYPFVYWWWGDDVWWTKSHCRANSWNSAEQNYVPRSVISSSGTPWTENKFLSYFIIVFEVVEFILKTKGKFEK